MKLLFTLALLIVPFSVSQAANPKYTPEDNQLWLDIPTLDKTFGDETFPVQMLKSEGGSERLYLWINEPYPPNNGDAIVSKGLRKTGEVWFVDIADALFMTREKTGYRNLSGDFLLPVFQEAITNFEEVVVITSDVSSVPVLRGLRGWQESADAAQRQRLINVVLMFPSLFVNTPAAGQPREIFPIAESTALPISIIQPERGSQANTIQETAGALIAGGSLVDIHRIPKGADGYYRYQNIRKMSELTGELIPQLVATKQKVAKQIGFTVPAMEPEEQLKNPPESQRIAGIKKLNEPIKIENIQLKDYRGKEIDLLRDYEGKTLLINFWATWCPPCVEEIPSMNEALSSLGKDNFEIVSISYRDPLDVMQDFVKKVPVEFPVLMDLDGEVSKQWKVFAFPSSFLVDAQGYIRYSINAGHIWNTPDALDQLKSLPFLKPIE